MFVRIEKNRIQYVKPKVILQLDELYDIIGYTNNSTTYKVELISSNNSNILCVANDWSEYLQMIKYAREIVK